MIGISLKQLQYQTRFAMHTIVRDAPKRFATIALMTVLIWWFGHVQFAVAFAALTLLSEVGSALLSRRMPKDWRKISRCFIAACWSLNVSSSIVFAAPAILLAGHGSVAALLTGFMWLFGVFVHITNTFALIPIYNWSLMVPSFMAGFGVFWAAGQSDVGGSSSIEWAIASALLIVYFANTVETLSGQKDTHRALTAARIEADTRMRALEKLTNHDTLTGLFNRKAFDDTLEKRLRDKDRQAATAVLILDLDGFKPINDTYSHEAGDQVLQAVGQRMKAMAGENGIAGRLGGDEFAMAFCDMPSDAAALDLARKVAREIEMPVSFGEKELRVGVSIGINMSRNPNDRVEVLCAGADQAMYRAKSDAGEVAVIYRAEDFPHRASLEDRKTLLAAMAAGDIRPHYQPKVFLGSGRIYGFEALARWHHPTDGLLSPAKFLPQINELGLQGDFLQHMASMVLSDVESFLTEGLEPGQVSINVPEVALATHSGRADLEALLGLHPNAREHITLEITEDVFIARSAEMIKASIAHFRSAGTRVSLDDFGTGFASFQHLRQLEFDELKIDTSFVADLGKDHRTEVLVAGFLSMAEGLEVAVIAEGVETTDQLDFLRTMGCQIGQGYLFGRARPFEETHLRLQIEAARAPRHRPIRLQA